MATAQALLTAEEYRLLPDNGQPTELVRGRIVPVNIPAPQHGAVCVNVVMLVGSFARRRKLGRVVSNDSAIVTAHDPDSVRGADVAYYSYARLPKGPVPKGYLDVVPELAWDVRSPGDSWRKVRAKVAEYLNAGVTAVCILDCQTEIAEVHYADQPTRVFGRDEKLVFPDILPGFRVAVQKFFE
jgi:Uma2 family endonuclease